MLFHREIVKKNSLIMRTVITEAFVYTVSVFACQHCPFLMQHLSGLRGVVLSCAIVPEICAYKLLSHPDRV